MASEHNELQLIAERALEFVPEGGVVGLGTGHAATAFIHALAESVRKGLRVRGVPTSQETATLASRLGIPLVTLEEVDMLDVDVDGADEVDPDGNMVKGYGGALVREKIVAATARRLVILVGPEKLVPILGSRHVLPVEVVPFGVSLCRRKLAALGCTPGLRMHHGQPFVSDNGNYLLDCRISTLPKPAEFEQKLLLIPGVVDTGLFLNMQPTVLVQTGQTVEVRPGKPSG